jgi:polar amino acid transport system substrate-binding protein
MRKSRTVAAALALVAVLLGISACQSSTARKADSGPPASPLPSALAGFSTVTPGVLTVATNLPGPGFWNGDSPSTLTGGYEYGMAKYMARHLGLTLKVVNVGWDALVSGAAKGFDLALSTINITPERAKIATFSVAYMSSDQGILVRHGTTVTAANARSLRWGVEQASTSLAYLDSTLKPTTAPSIFQDQPSMFTALAAHQVDAVLLDTVEVLAEAKQSDGALAVVGQYQTGGVYGALLPKGSPNVNKVSTLIRQMKGDGTLTDLSQRFLVPQFGQNPTSVPYLNP